MFLKKLYKNPNNRILGLVFLGYLLICTYFTLWTYNRYRELSEKSTLLRLEGIVNSLALQIDGDIHRRLTQRYVQKDDILFNAQDTDYYHIHHALRMNYEANMLTSPVYTMIFDTTKNHFEFIATSSEQPYYRHEYDTYNAVLRDKYDVGSIMPMYKDTFGTWLSAFAPIRDKKGVVTGVVMADEDFSFFLTTARSMAIRDLMMSLFTVLPFVIILIYVLRKMVLNEGRLKQKLENAFNANLKMSKQLEESYEKLSSIDTLRKEMIANISHDLRTPLTNLSGYIETLYINRHDISMSDRERYLTIAMRESERLKKMIEDLFELSKLESNQIKLNIEPFPIAEVLHDILSKYEVICAQKGIELKGLINENAPWVAADIRLIDRVLQNLLDNAVRYNWQISDNNDEPKKISVELTQAENQVNILIANTGKTIPPSVLPHIFDRYYKTLSLEASTGLGLAIVKKIIELHDSKISVTSDDNLTVFQFELKIYQPNM